jgi:hypothetical protein
MFFGLGRLGIRRRNLQKRPEPVLLNVYGAPALIPRSPNSERESIMLCAVVSSLEISLQISF